MDAHPKATYTHSIDKASLEKYDIGFMAMKYKVKPDEDDYADSKIKFENLFDGTTNGGLSTKNDGKQRIEMLGTLLIPAQVNSWEIRRTDILLRLSTVNCVIE